MITGGAGGKATVNVAMDNSLVVTRFLFFYPTGPKSQKFGGGGQGPIAGKLKIKDFMFLQQDDSSDDEKSKKKRKIDG